MPNEITVPFIGFNIGMPKSVEIDGAEIVVRYPFTLQTRRVFEGLSPRETEILGLIQKNLSNKQIAGELCISERTVKFHVSSIFSKTGRQSRRDL